MRLAKIAVASEEGKAPSPWALWHRWAMESMRRSVSEDECDSKSRIHVWDDDIRILGP